MQPADARSCSEQSAAPAASTLLKRRRPKSNKYRAWCTVPASPLRNPRDLLGEVDLAVVLRRIADHAARVGDAPEVVGVAAHAVEHLERHAMLVGDVRRFDALDHE